ncbi:Tyrosine aminotransferase, partial [Phytophthora palmivora]
MTKNAAFDDHNVNHSTSQWKVHPSDLSKRCCNPIRKIVDNIKMPVKSSKTRITLSLGDPTVFGNLHCPDVLVQAIVRNT